MGGSCIVWAEKRKRGCCRRSRLSPGRFGFRGEKKERGRILTGILFLAAVFGCTLSVLEMLEPPVDKKVFLGGIFFLAVIWQIICWNKKTCAWGQMILWAQCDSVCHFPLGQDPDRGKNGGKYSA